MKEINLNELILVQLNEEGLKILNQYHIDLFSTTNNIHKTQQLAKDSVDNIEKYHTKIIDGKKYYEFHLWDFCNIFGSKLYMGCKCPFINNSIYLKENETIS